MGTVIIGLAAVSTLITGATLARTYELQQRDVQNAKAGYDLREARYQGPRPEDQHAPRRWVRGEAPPQPYFGDRYTASDSAGRPARDPDTRYRWVHDNEGNYYLRAAIAPGPAADDPG